MNNKPYSGYEKLLYFINSAKITSYIMERGECFMNAKTIKIIGIVASVAGAAASVLGTWAGEKQQEVKIAEKVAEAMANKQD